MQKRRKDFLDHFPVTRYMITILLAAFYTIIKYFIFSQLTQAGIGSSEGPDDALANPDMEGILHKEGKF